MIWAKGQSSSPPVININAMLNILISTGMPVYMYLKLTHQFVFFIDMK